MSVALRARDEPRRSNGGSAAAVLLLLSLWCVQLSCEDGGLLSCCLPACLGGGGTMRTRGGEQPPARGDDGKHATERTHTNARTHTRTTTTNKQQSQNTTDHNTDAHAQRTTPRLALQAAAFRPLREGRRGHRASSLPSTVGSRSIIRNRLIQLEACSKCFMRASCASDAGSIVHAARGQLSLRRGGCSVQLVRGCDCGCEVLQHPGRRRMRRRCMRCVS